MILGIDRLFIPTVAYPLVVSDWKETKLLFLVLWIFYSTSFYSKLKELLSRQHNSLLQLVILCFYAPWAHLVIISSLMPLLCHTNLIIIRQATLRKRTEIGSVEQPIMFLNIWSCDRKTLKWLNFVWMNVGKGIIW